jgi:hypothetical protein
MRVIRCNHFDSRMRGTRDEVGPHHYVGIMLDTDIRLLDVVMTTVGSNNVKPRDRQ